MPEQISHQRVACLLLALFQYMRILPEHKARIGVSDELLDRTRVFPCIEHIGDHRVSKIMQTHSGKPGFLCSMRDMSFYPNGTLLL